MSKEFMRKVFNSLLPPGPLFVAQLDKDMDNLFNGISANAEVPRAFLAQLSDIRNPFKTTILSDLEREYGILTNENIPEDTRRQRLASLVYASASHGSEDDLQSALDAAGFNVLIHQNDPAVDPAIFLTQAFLMVAGGDNAYAGRTDAFAGQTGGELLVNGDIFQTRPIYTSVAGTMYAGDGSVAGTFDDFETVPIEYEVPTDPLTWPAVFFVGGPATRDAGTGALTDIEFAEVPTERQVEFKKIILAYKPLHTWAGLIIVFT